MYAFKQSQIIFSNSGKNIFGGVNPHALKQRLPPPHTTFSAGMLIYLICDPQDLLHMLYRHIFSCPELE